MAQKKQTWRVEIKMTLGKETILFSKEIDLNKDVKTVLQAMLEIKNESQEAICSAYDSILASSAKDFSARHVSRRQKTGDQK